MRIELNNLAAVQHADIEIDGITVIAGENDTGKSTVSKALWCMFDSFYKYDQQFDAYRSMALEDAVKVSIPSALKRRYPPYLFSRRVVDRLKRRMGDLVKDPSRVKEVVANAFEDALHSARSDEDYFDIEDLQPMIEQIEQIVSYGDLQLICGVMENNFLSEFSQQPCNVDSPEGEAQVTLTIQGEPVTTTIVDNRVQSVSSLVHLDVRGIYVDDSFILDDVALRPRISLFDEDRHMRLRRLLSNSKSRNRNVLSSMMAKDKLEMVFAQMGRALPGELSWREPGELGYIPAGYLNPINARNISAGMKTFAILDMLLRNGSIEQKSVIILDEPEVHLHPEWQLVFAELIVLLQVSFGLHILLTTHSPYFLRAIQIYSAKHSIATHCRYYQSARDGKWCDIQDVTYRTAPIFDRLVRPFEELERELSDL